MSIIITIVVIVIIGIIINIKDAKSRKKLNAARYWISKDYNESGPYGFEQVRTKIISGQITRDYYIRKEDSSFWTKIDQCPDFFGVPFVSQKVPAVSTNNTNSSKPIITDREKEIREKIRIFNKRDDYDSLITVSSEGIIAFPETALFYHVRSFANSQLGNISKAIPDARIAVKLDPSDTDYREWLETLIALQKHEEAEKIGAEKAILFTLNTIKKEI